jgi:lipid II:glycine glycyltransferase (peptidoglycan interpeptide bridge formation enzyme)
MTHPVAPPLPEGYAVEVDDLDASSWHVLLDRFADANVYQTWAYESVRSGEARMSHWRLLRQGQVVAAAQVKLVKLPLLRLGVAYVRWGPMWRLRGEPGDSHILRHALHALHHEYAVRRGLSLRLLPYLFSDEPPATSGALRDAGFHRLEADAAQRTLVMSLDATLPTLRSRLDQKWRNGLNRAERNGLEVEEGTSDALFARFADIHAQMHRRKGFNAMSDVSEFRAMQGRLPERHRMRVLLASSNGLPAAGVVVSRIGDFGIFLHGATSDAGMNTQASYLLQWKALDWLKAQGAASYNLHGINPLANPGTYHFKAGLCGKNGRDVHYIGAHEASAGARAQALMDMADSMRRAYRGARQSARQLAAIASRQPGA